MNHVTPRTTPTIPHKRIPNKEVMGDIINSDVCHTDRSITISVQTHELTMLRSEWMLRSELMKLMLESQFKEGQVDTTRIYIGFDETLLTVTNWEVFCSLVCDTPPIHDIHDGVVKETMIQVDNWLPIYSLLAYLKCEAALTMLQRQIEWYASAGVAQFLDFSLDYARGALQLDNGTVEGSPKRLKRTTSVPRLSLSGIVGLYFMAKTYPAYLPFDALFVKQPPLVREDNDVRENNDVREDGYGSGDLVGTSAYCDIVAHLEEQLDPVALLDFYRVWHVPVVLSGDATIRAPALLCPFAFRDLLAYDPRSVRTRSIPVEYMNYHADMAPDEPHFDKYELLDMLVQTGVSGDLLDTFDVASPAVAQVTLQDRATFEFYWAGLYQPLLGPNFDWDGVVAAGGAVLYALDCMQSHRVSKDIDLFVYGATKEARDVTVRRLVHYFEEEWPGGCQYALCNSVISLYPRNGNPLPEGPTYVQLILTAYTSVYDVIGRFDFDYVQCAFDGERVQCTYEFLMALKTRVTCTTQSDACKHYRLCKALSKGFAVLGLQSGYREYMEERGGVASDEQRGEPRHVWPCYESANALLEKFSFRPFTTSIEASYDTLYTTRLCNVNITLEPMTVVRPHMQPERGWRYIVSDLGTCAKARALRVKTPPLRVAFDHQNIANDEHRQFLTLDMESNSSPETVQFIALMDDIREYTREHSPHGYRRAIINALVDNEQHLEQEVVYGLPRWRAPYGEDGRRFYDFPLTLLKYQTNLRIHASLAEEIKTYEVAHADDAYPIGYPIPKGVLAVVDFNIVYFFKDLYLTVCKEVNEVTIYPASMMEELNKRRL